MDDSTDELYFQVLCFKCGRRSGGGGTSFSLNTGFLPLARVTINYMYTTSRTKHTQVRFFFFAQRSLPFHCGFTWRILPARKINAVTAETPHFLTNLRAISIGRGSGALRRGQDRKGAGGSPVRVTPSHRKKGPKK